MSAIFGIYYLDGRPLQPQLLEKMSGVLAHRGSDGAGIWHEGPVGLGHRMRRTTPESLDEQLPKSKHSGSFVITADARIDNRDDLLKQLAMSPRSSSETLCDSEIILLAYEKWGEECAQKLLGDFVFAIWDAKKQKLFCARDSMGVKHFYYYYKPNELFAIASEIKALLCIEGIPVELNEDIIGDILILNFNDKENTPYKDIKRLAANNALVIDRSRLRIWQYWHPVQRRAAPFKSNRDYEDEFREIFATAVNCRLRSAYRVGSMLSGGLDSSSISCVASQHLSEQGRQPLETFSAVFPTIAEIDPRIDERRFIDSVVNHITCNANFVEADALNPLHDMKKMHWHADHPIGVPNVFMDWALFKAAKERDVRVLLSGFDGDSTVSYGYEALSTLARQGRWVRLISDAIALNKNMPHRQHSIKKLVWKQGFEPAIPEFARQLRRILAGRPRNLPVTRSLPSAHKFSYGSIDRVFAEKHELENRYFEQIKKGQPEGVDLTNEWWNSLCNGLFAFALETFEKTSAAFEVEPRFPFFDRRLIEFCMALPASQKLYMGWTRSIFRRAMAGILPPDVQWRTDKANIGLSFKINMLNYGRSDVEEAIFESPGTLEKYINIESLVDAYRRYEADPLKYEGEPMFIMSSVYLSNWLRNSFGCEAG
jgi:asparagine synthase (glutamine-hydrolysing)